MKHLTDEELRKVRLAGNIARGLKMVLLLAVLALIAIIGMAVVIQVTGVEIPPLLPLP